jgi:hypothetical protein
VLFRWVGVAAQLFHNKLAKLSVTDAGGVLVSPGVGFVVVATILAVTTAASETMSWTAKLQEPCEPVPAATGVVVQVACLLLVLGVMV